MEFIILFGIIGWIGYAFLNFLISDPIEYEESQREKKRKDRDPN